MAERMTHLEYVRALKAELDSLNGRGARSTRGVDQETIERIANALKRRETVRNR